MRPAIARATWGATSGRQPRLLHPGASFGTGHGRTKGLAVAPSAGRQQFDQVVVTPRDQTCQSWRLKRPTRNRLGGIQPKRCTLQPVRGIERPRVGARSVALRAHGDALHDVLAASYSIRFGALPFRFLPPIACLGPGKGAQEHDQDKLRREREGSAINIEVLRRIHHDFALPFGAWLLESSLRIVERNFSFVQLVQFLY